MVLTLCILAIIVSIVIGWKFKFNTGIIAMGFAFLLGFFGLGMKINDIIAFWPTTIVFYLLSISLFFTYATQNGTMDVLGRKMLYALGGNAKLIPVAIALVCAIVGGLGAGASTPAIIGPFAFAMAISAGVNPALAAICIGFGNLIGSNNPYNGYGGVISKNLIIANEVEEGRAMVMSNYIWVNMIIIVLIVLAVFYFLFKGFKAEKVSVEKPPAFNAVQKKTFAIVVIAFLAMVVPSLLNTWIKDNLVISQLAGICQPQVIMVIGALVCAFMKLGDEKKVIKGIPINTIVMIVGVYMLIKVASEAGLIDAVSSALTSSIPRFFVPGAIVLFAAFLSFFSSSTSTVMPLMYPLVPVLAASLGMNEVALYSCIFFGGLSTAMSPFSTGGALTIASCPDNEVKDNLPNPMIVVSLIIPLITAVLATLGLFNIFHV